MNRQLLFSVTKKDFKIEYFSGTGKGGQYRNKHQNCVRIHHPESGAIVTGQSNRDRINNTREAFENLRKHPKFKIWNLQKVKEAIDGITLSERVNEMMSPGNIKIERIDDSGKWIPYENLDGPTGH